LATAASYFRTSAVLLSLLLGAAGASLPWLYVLRKRSKRFALFEQMLPEALDLIVSALRAGHGLTSAIGTVAKEMTDPIAKEFRQCFDEQNFGLDLRAAMVNLAGRVPIHDVRIIVTAVLVQKESGGNLAEVLDKVASIIRERFRLKRQIQVHTAQGRLTGWILAVLPLVLGIGLYLLNPESMSVLWKNPTGLKLLYGAVVMTIIGALIIRKIVRVRV
jgi:tight adherence protein B